jgi:hypothetical protein
MNSESMKRVEEFVATFSGMSIEEKEKAADEVNSVLYIARVKASIDRRKVAGTWVEPQFQPNRSSEPLSPEELQDRQKLLEQFGGRPDPSSGVQPELPDDIAVPQ